MDPYQQVKEKLDELGISFDVVEHPPAFTTEQADSYIEGLEGVRTKTMFLTNKKKTQYYLLIMDDQRPLDMDDFREQVGANRIRKDIVSEEIMTFHPNTNEKTIFIKTQDLFRFLEVIGFHYEILTLP